MNTASSSDTTVAQDSFQREDVAALHHVVAGEGVPQDVGQLVGCVQTGAFVVFAECPSAGSEQPARSWVATLQHQLCQIIRHVNKQYSLWLRTGEIDLSTGQISPAYAEADVKLAEQNVGSK